MKLLFIIDSLSKGGIATVLKHRLNHLAKNKYFEIYLLTEFENNAIIQAEFDDNITFHILSIQKILKKKRLPFFGYFELRKELKEVYVEQINNIRPDVITTFNVGTITNFIVPYIECKAIKIIEFHGAYNPREYLVKRKILVDKRIVEKIIQPLRHPINLFVPKEKDLHSRYNYGVVLTNEDKEDREKYLKIPLIHINNFMISPAYVRPFKNRENIIVGIGRMVEQKNFSDLIKAIDLIKDQLHSWQVHIYGDGEQYKFIENQIIMLKLDKIVYLKGFSYNMKDVYNNSKLLVTTALWEGQPMNILEAFSFKIPVISYNCKCGPKEIIRDGINGFLVDYSISELADRIIDLIIKKDLLDEFSTNTNNDLNKFEYNKIMSEWQSFYNLLK